MKSMSLINKITNFFRKKNPEKEGHKVIARDYTGKFVKQNGMDIGESIAVEDNRFVIKNPDGFMSVPLDAVITNNENIVVGDFNREESLQFGKEWSERKDALKFDEKGMLVK